MKPDLKTGRILIVDDEEIALKNLRRLLEKEGHIVSTCLNPVKAAAWLAEQPFDLLLTDLKMPYMDGLELTGAAKRNSPGIEVIIITGYATVDSAIEATKIGAFHYLTKPVKPDEVRHLVGKALEHKALREEAGGGSNSANHTPEIIGHSLKIRQVKEIIRQIAPTDCSVLITGESGSGKELAARAIHAQSARTAGPFVAFNCGALTEELIANELFGHEKEAFTGASSLKKGLLETADRGTLFLDEIGEMPLSMQVKLLRVMQERELTRVGGTKSIPLDVRIISATARDLKAAVAEQAFRSDLYFRLNVVNLALPGLSERPEDIPLLAYHFLHKLASRMGKKINAISEQAMTLLNLYAFPGNVRELENIIERAVALSNSDTIQPHDLPPDLAELELFSFKEDGGEYLSLEEMEKKYITFILQRTGGARAAAAELLGIDRVSLWRKMKKYNL